MVQFGKRDEIVRLADALGIVGPILAPTCTVVYEEAGHLAWTDLQPSLHDVTTAATIAFLDEAFAGRRPTEASLRVPPPNEADCR
jgi:hypothetical protein